MRCKMDLSKHKQQIEARDKKTVKMCEKIYEKYVKPYFNDKEKLQEIVCQMPDSIFKFFTYQRIEELKKI